MVRNLILAFSFLLSSAALADPAGAADTVLRVPAAGGKPAYGSVDLSKSAAVGSSILGYANGGTMQSSVTQGDLLYGSATNTWSKLAKGTTGQYLAQTATIPAWTTMTPMTVQTLTGSGTYTLPTNPSPKYITVVAVGGGGGGGGSGTAGGADGNAGGNTTFGSTVVVANGGGAGRLWSINASNPPGTASLSGANGIALTGGYGGTSLFSTGTSLQGVGGMGGSSALGGGGTGGYGGTAASPGANGTGGGGGGGGFASGIANIGGGAGGSSGGYAQAVITSPSATYSYSVGVGGAGGAAGTNGVAGAAGGNGGLWVFESYQ